MKKPVGYRLAGKSILLVDDEEGRRLLFADFLKVLQTNCDTASEGRAGQEMILNNTYDLIVLDVMLDDILGWDIYRQVREQQPGFNTPVLFLTNLGEEARVVFESLNVGERCRLESKSVPINDLVEVMESMLLSAS